MPIGRRSTKSWSPVQVPAGQSSPKKAASKARGSAFGFLRSNLTATPGPDPGPRIEEDQRSRRGESHVSVISRDSFARPVELEDQRCLIKGAIYLGPVKRP